MTIRKKTPRSEKREERKSRLVTITRRYRNSQTFNLLFFSRCRVCVGGNTGWWCRFRKSSLLICSTRYSQALFCVFSCSFCSNSSGKKTCSYKKVLKRMSGFGKRGRGHKKRFSSLFCSFFLFSSPPVSGRCCCHGGKREEGEKWSKKRRLTVAFHFGGKFSRERRVCWKVRKIRCCCLHCEGKEGGLALIKFLSFPLPCRYFQEKKKGSRKVFTIFWKKVE